MIQPHSANSLPYKSPQEEIGTIMNIPGAAIPFVAQGSIYKDSVLPLPATLPFYASVNGNSTQIYFAAHWHIHLEGISF